MEFGFYNLSDHPTVTLVQCVRTLRYYYQAVQVLCTKYGDEVLIKG